MSLKDRFDCVLTVFQNEEDVKTISFLELLDFCDFIATEQVEELYPYSRLFLKAYDDISDRMIFGPTSAKNQSNNNQDQDQYVATSVIVSAVRAVYNSMESDKLFAIENNLKPRSAVVTFESIKQETVKEFLDKGDLRTLLTFRYNRSTAARKKYAQLIELIGQNSHLFIENFEQFGQPLIELIETFNQKGHAIDGKT